MGLQLPAQLQIHISPYLRFIQTMSTQAFHRFVELPFELQHLVWDLALDTDNAANHSRAGYIGEWDRNNWTGGVVFLRPNAGPLRLEFVLFYGVLVGEHIFATSRFARLAALEWWYRQIEMRKTSELERVAMLKRDVLCVLEELVVATKASLIMKGEV